MTLLPSFSGRALRHPTRRQFLHTAGAAALLPLGGCFFTDSGDVTAPEALKRDPHSNANIDQVVMTHVQLSLTVDFTRQVLDGAVELTLEPRSAGVTTLVLDTKALLIKGVQRLQAGQYVDTGFMLGESDDILGQALTIAIQPDTRQVRVQYETTAASDGINWATPEQTSGKQQPMLYSLSQSIYGRTWFPHQDTPAIRVTYSADIHTPADMVAKMSAANAASAVPAATHHFEMAQPIVPYLIALAVGDFAFEPLSARSGVYAEPGVVARAAYEFAEVEQMMAAVESLYGTYAWQRYDMMVMPPSFPFGGMEHARLSFLTPTVLTGDRQLVSLNAHELAHAWSGNLVTNRYWRDLWLNEGFTTYVEKRVIEQLYGTARADDERVVQYRQLQAELADLEPAAQVLAIDLAGQHPDNVFTQIPYDKGSLFLTTLEHLFGRSTFDAFVRDYFAHFANRTLTTEQFEQYLYERLVDRIPGRISHEKVREWIYQPGYPSDGHVPVSASFTRLDVQRDALAGGGITAAQLDVTGWTVNHWMYLFQTLPTTVDPAVLQALDARFALSASTNLILVFHWLRVALRAGYQAAIDQRLGSFLAEQGRIKLTKPLYQELVKTPAGTTLALALFAQTRASLHPITVWEIETNVFGKAGIALGMRARPH